MEYFCESLTCPIFFALLYAELRSGY